MNAQLKRFSDTPYTGLYPVGREDTRMPTTVAQEQNETHYESIVIIRPSFKKICDGEPCRAALFNHILYWIAKKRKAGIDYWYSTGDGLYHDLAESWGVTQIRREINKLINSNLVGVMKNPRMGIDRTKHFIFQAANATIFFARCVKEKICIFCLGLCKEVIDLLQGHLIDLLNAHPNEEAFDKSIKCVCAQHEKHLIDLSKPFDKSITPITQVSYSGNYVNPNESVSESNMSSSLEDDALPPYENGYQGTSDLKASLQALILMNDAFLAQLEQELSTPPPPVDNDTSSHSHSQKPMPTRKPRKRKAVEVEKPAINLTKQQQAFWLLWCDVWFNQDIPPDLNDTAYKHICKLAPHIKTKEQLESLTTFARKELEQSGFKRKHIFLGNLVGCYAAWKQEGQKVPVACNVSGDGGIWKTSKNVAPEEDIVFWQGEYMTVVEADKRGFNGGFGAYN